MKTLSFTFDGVGLPGSLDNFNQENVLIQIFDALGDREKLSKLVVLLKEKFNNPIIVGTSTPLAVNSGEFVEDLVCSISSFEKTHLDYKIIHDFSIFKKTIYDMVREDTKGFLIFANRKTKLEMLNDDMADFNDYFVFGTFGDSNIIGDYEICSDVLEDESIVIISFNGEIEFHTGVISSYYGIGKNDTVSKVKGSRLYEIGNMTVLDYYKNFFKIDEETAKKTFEYFPLICTKYKHSPISILKLYDDGSVELPINLGLGDRIRLSMPNLDRFEPKLVEMLDFFSKVDVESAFIYSSIPQFNYITYANDEDLKKMATIIPISGVYGSVDIGYINGQNRFITGSTVVVSMAENEAKHNFIYNPIGEAKFVSLGQRFMVKLLSKVSKDYDELDKFQTMNESLTASEYLNNTGYYDEVTGLPNLSKMVEDVIPREKEFNITACKLTNERFLREFYGNTFIDECKRELINNIQREYDANVKMYSLVEGFASISIMHPAQHKRMMEEVYQKFYKYGFSFKNELIDFGYTYATVFKGEKNPIIRVKRALYEAIELGKVYREYQQTPSSYFEKKLGFDQYTLVSNAYKNHNFRVFYQGIYDVKKKIIRNFESLIRIEDNGQIYSPYYFIDVAYKFGYSRYITMYCMEQAFKNIMKYGVSISINLRLTDLEDDDLFSHFTYLLSQYGHAENILIEILEDEEVMQNTVSLNRLKDLKNMGIKIAVDDFGAGYSNFDYFQEGIFDYIKISGNLTRNILDDDAVVLDMIRAIINTTHRFGLKVVVEYCENEKVASILEDLGADFIQGFYFSKPNPELIIK